MKRWLLYIAVLLSVLTVTWGAWWYWYSADQLSSAVNAGDAAKVCRLIRLGARTDKVKNILHWAAIHGDLPVAELLLARGADVDGKENTDGMTPLHSAAIWNSLAVAELLLAKGAEVDNKGTDGSTPLHLAAMYDRRAVAKLLLSNGADPNAKDRNGKTPIEMMRERQSL